MCKNPRCRKRFEISGPGLTSEVKTYKWKEDRDGNVLDEPVKFKDDAIAACRYAIEEKTEYTVSMLDVL